MEEHRRADTSCTTKPDASDELGHLEDQQHDAALKLGLTFNTMGEVARLTGKFITPAKSLLASAGSLYKGKGLFLAGKMPILPRRSESEICRKSVASGRQ